MESKPIKLKVRDIFQAKKIYIEDNGRMIFLMDKEKKFIIECHIISGNLKMVKKMVLVVTSGI